MIDTIKKIQAVKSHATTVASDRYKRILEAFARKAKVISKIRNLNCGGCGVAALAMYRYLTANGIRVEIYAGYRDYLCYEHSRDIKRIRNGLDPLYVPNHIYLKVGAKLYDSDMNSKELNADFVHSAKINERMLLTLLNESSNWNHAFDRKSHINFIEAVFEVDLSDVKV